MIETKFYLKEKSAEGKTSLLMVVFYGNDRMRCYTGISIEAKNWNPKKQRARETLEFEEGAIINERIDLLKGMMNSLMRKYKDLGYYPVPSVLKVEFLKMGDKPFFDKRSKSWWHHFDDFIDYKQKELSDVRDYKNSLQKHLIAIERKVGYNLQFEILANPESDFPEQWNHYLLYEALNSEGNPGLTTNTAGKLNKNLKVFLNWCFDRNITQRFSLKKYPTSQEDVDKVYITESELCLITDLELVDKQFQVVRDLFVIGCETGMRFSDFIRIEPEDIRDNQIHFRPKKTSKSSNNKLIVPISTRLDSIFRRYNYIPPKFSDKNISDFNKMLREICRIAGVDSQVVRYRKIAGKEIKEIRLKYEEISSHTCRRTFCTLKFLKGMPAQAIMKFSGHKTERNFLKYLKLDAELTASKYQDFF